MRTDNLYLLSGKWERPGRQLTMFCGLPVRAASVSLAVARAEAEGLSVDTVRPARYMPRMEWASGEALELAATLCGEGGEA